MTWAQRPPPGSALRASPPSPPLRGGRDKNNGGIAEHPIHDEDMEDRGAEFCERLANRPTGGLDAPEDETPPK